MNQANLLEATTSNLMRPGSSSSPDGNASAMTEELGQSGYAFPDYKLKKVMDDATKTPLVLVACGAFSPVTYLHLRMSEMVADYVRQNTDFEVVGEYLSPVSDAYKKKGLANAKHRLNMCQLAADATPRVMVDPWEALKEEYTRTAVVLDHVDHEINKIRGGIEVEGGKRRAARIILLAGADLIGTMSVPGVWSDEDLDHILARYGAFIIERQGTDMEEALATLQSWRKNIFVVPQRIQNDVSSTKIRALISDKMSIQYLVPPNVINYIAHHKLYEE